MYGECSTAAATKKKEVTIYGFKLYKGAQITIKFTYSNSVADPTLVINNGEENTAAIPLKRYGTTKISTGTTTNGWIAGAVQNFTYDGTNWVADYWYNTTYSAFEKSGESAKAGLVPAPPSTAGTTKYLREDGTWTVPPNTNTTYSASTGLTLTGTTFSVTSANVSTMMNLLGEGTSPAQLDDYLIAQYAGGGTTTISYHRRKVRNVVNATVVKAALGTGDGTTKYLREDGEWVVPPSYSLPTASSTTLGGVKIGTGIEISSGVISNSGVRSIATGTINGTISVNTNGTSTDVAVKGLGSAAYTASTAYDAAGAAAAVKNDLLNGAGDAYDTLKELGNLIDDNTDAIDALEIVAGNKTPKTQAIPYIVGPGTDIAGAWTGTSTDITAYADGLTIIYVPGVAGHEDGTSLKINNLDAIPCYVTNTSKLTTHFAAGTPVMLTYVKGQWRRADYDANNYAYARQYLTASSTTAYPILFRYNTTAPTNSAKYRTEYIRYATAITATPAGTLTATEFKGNLAASYITGTLGVSHGGTGATTFTSGEALIGAGTNAVTTRGINNMTTKSYIAYDTKLMTTNTLAYWNGAYTDSGASNLTYCNQGAFGNIVTKSYTDSTSASAIGTGTSVPTERDIYYGLPTINNSHSYTSSTAIYAPAEGGTAGQYLKAVGNTSAPVWTSFAGLTIKTKDVAGTETTKVNVYTPATAVSAIIGPDDIFKIHSYSVTKALALNTWTDVATAANLGSPVTGTYILQVTAGSVVYSGVMSWDSSTTAASGVYDEILLHSASTSSAHVTARVNRDGSLRLQLCALNAAVASSSITIKMRRMI